MKNRSKLAVIAIIFWGSFFFAGGVEAKASATVFWTAPTTDKGGGSLTGLSGYRVYYHNSSTWLGMMGKCLLGAGRYVDVPAKGPAMSHFFNNILSPGSTYYFTVAALDGNENISDCATGSGGLTEVSKRVTYSGDLNASQSVDILDYNILKTNFGTNSANADINKNGTVDYIDYNILKEDYGLSFS